jgi:hypothetical protein
VIRLFDRGVTAAELCSVPFLVDPAADAVSARRQFDVLGYFAAPLDGPPVGRSEVRILGMHDATPDGPAHRTPPAVPTATVAECSTALPAEASVAPGTPLPAVLRALARHRLVVVVDRRGGGPARIAGVITHRDLDRPVVRLAALGLILWLEPNLDRLVHDAAGDGWPALLSPSRRDRLGSVRPVVQRPGAGLRAMGVLNLDDRLTLVRRLPDLRRRLGWASTGEFRRFAERLRRARDGLAHGGSVVDACGGGTEAVALLLGLRDLVTRVGELVAELAPAGSVAAVLSGDRTPPAAP